MNRTPRPTVEDHQTQDQTIKKRGGRWEWLVGTCCLWVLVILLVLALLALSISKLAMGIMYFNDCPLASMVPVYLIVSACATVTMIGFYKLMPEEGENKIFEEKLNIGTIVGLLGLLFIFIWLICGSVWVFEHYTQVMNGCEPSTLCCDKGLLQYSAVITIVDWIFVAVALITIVVTLLLVCCARMCK